MTNGSNDIVNELITKHLAGETSVEEERELSDWIGRSEENERHYHAFRRAFNLTDQHFAIPGSADLGIDIDQEWNRFNRTIGSQPTTPHLSPSQLWLRIAATVLLLVVCGALLYFFSFNATTRYETAGNTETVTLPDGSKVTLNRNSSLSYNRDFGEEHRTVNLEGEAFFEVEPEAGRPFIIFTGSAKVQVLGTSFNVTAYDSLREVEVIVQTGIVSFAQLTGDKKVQLTAGQKGVYSKTTEQIASAVNGDINFLSWNTKRMVFIEKDLHSVIETLKKTYHVDISVTADIPATCLVTVTFDHQSLESVLKVLESTLNLKYTVEGNEIEIYEAGC